VGQRDRVEETRIEGVRRIFDVNVFGPVALTQAVLPGMLARGAGRVAVVSSVLGKFGAPGRPAYAASKHALHGYFDSVRAEVHDCGVRVTLVCPGYGPARLRAPGSAGHRPRTGRGDDRRMGDLGGILKRFAPTVPARFCAAATWTSGAAAPIGQGRRAMRMKTALLAVLCAVGALAGRAGAAEPGQARTPCRTIQRMEAHEHQHLVMYGTSITWATTWVDQLTRQLYRRYPGYVTSTNAGMNSKNSRWGVRHLEERVLARNPDCVFLEFAINDAYAPYEVSLEESRKNLEDLIDRVQAFDPDCEVILLVTNPVQGKAAPVRPDLEAYYDIPRAVGRECGLLVIDLFPRWAQVLREDPDKFKRYAPDLLHPGPVGCRELITPAILEAMGAKPLDPD